VAGVVSSPDRANLIVLGAVVDDLRAASDSRLFLAASSCSSASTEANLRFFNAACRASGSGRGEFALADLPVVIFPFSNGCSVVAPGRSPSSTCESVMEDEVLEEASALASSAAFSEVAGGFPSSS
jgi:hypothetical protein